MSILCSVLIVAVAGGIGGLFHAFLVDNTLGKPKEGWDGWGLALLVNIIGGAIAGALSWGLYGPLSAYPVFGSPPAGSGPPASMLTLSALASAVVIGFGGPRWLQNEVDKRLLKEAASTAASKQADAVRSQAMHNATPLQVRNLAREMPA